MQTDFLGTKSCREDTAYLCPYSFPIIEGTNSTEALHEFLSPMTHALRTRGGSEGRPVSHSEFRECKAYACSLECDLLQVLVAVSSNCTEV